MTLTLINSFHREASVPLSSCVTMKHANLTTPEPKKFELNKRKSGRC